MTIDRYRGPRRIRLNGQLLAALRVNRNLSLQNIADVCSVSRQAVCLWEQERSVPDDYCIERLSMLFGDDLNTAVNVKEWE
jgi:predicted transcriptional regulator